jgi:hypothetical protein
VAIKIANFALIQKMSTHLSDRMFLKDVIVKTFNTFIFSKYEFNMFLGLTVLNGIPHPHPPQLKFTCLHFYVSIKTANLDTHFYHVFQEKLSDQWKDKGFLIVDQALLDCRSSRQAGPRGWEAYIDLSRCRIYTTAARNQ